MKMSELILAVGDENVETQTYEKLVRYYQKPDYWAVYLRRASREDRTELGGFNWLRLMGDTGALNGGVPRRAFDRRLNLEFHGSRIELEGVTWTSKSSSLT